MHHKKTVELQMHHNHSFSQLMESVMLKTLLELTQLMLLMEIAQLAFPTLERLDVLLSTEMLFGMLLNHTLELY